MPLARYLYVVCCLPFLADPGKTRGCSTNTSVIISFIHSFIHSVSDIFPPTALRRRHAQTVWDSSFSYKIDYVIPIKNFLNPKGHQNPISGSKGMTILLKRLIVPIGGVVSGRVCVCSLRSRLVSLLSTLRHFLDLVGT